MQGFVEQDCKKPDNNPPREVIDKGLAALLSNFSRDGAWAKREECNRVIKTFSEEGFT
jgi:hypothetical protein